MQGFKPVLRGTLSLLALAIAPVCGAQAQGVTAIGNADALHEGQLDVPVNKSQVIRASRPFVKALVGNAEIADILPMTNRSLYVLGKKIGTTSLTMYDGRNNLVSVIDIAVGPDVVSLRRQLAELMPNEKIGATVSNDSVVLAGTVSSGPAIERARQIAATYAPEKVVNMLSVGAAQQVMLEVRFSEVSRSVGKQIGLNHSYLGDKAYGSVGGLAGQSTQLTKGTLPKITNTTPTINGVPSGPTIGKIEDIGSSITRINPSPQVATDLLTNVFGIGALAYSIGNLQLFSTLDALERKGLVKTLAEPTLIALSGETASFLAGGEFPIPVLQNAGGAGSQQGGTGITIEFKPFGVSLAFTPTVLDDGVISMIVAPEVSSIDSSASIAINGIVIPGLLTRRAKTTVELRDGQSFAIAGLLRNDFSDTVRQLPLLGSIPILGALFRSTGYQKDQTELVIIVTPRLIKPMRPEDVRLPTDRVENPNELDLFLRGRTDKAVGTDLMNPDARPTDAKRGKAKPATGLEGETGHEF